MALNSKSSEKHSSKKILYEYKKLLVEKKKGLKKKAEKKVSIKRFLDYQFTCMLKVKWSSSP